MDTPLKVINTLFKGMANADKFQAPDKDYAKMMEENFEKDDPIAFYASLDKEIQQLIKADEIESINEEDVEAFLIDLGAIIMLYTKHRDKTPQKKSRPTYKPAPKNTLKADTSKADTSKTDTSKDG